MDAVIIYTLDRLSRDLEHFIILLEELEKADVSLILVKDDVETIRKKIATIRRKENGPPIHACEH